jgi:isocitrate dehydrogenase (NAD+)
VALRKTLNLFANLRPVRNLPGVKSRFQEVDLVVVRENTEDVYAGIEHTVAPGVVECAKIITWDACKRVAEFAFDYARQNGRRKVTAVHKANIMKLSDGLFLAACRKVAKRYPKVHYDDVIVDALCMKLVLNPQQFDVLLCENLYGDIVSDLCAGLVGGLGMVASANYGKKACVFETVHGSAPDIVGKGTANPIAMILCARMMLQHIGEARAASRIQRGVETVLKAGRHVTPDIGGRGTTVQMTDAIIKAMK